MAVSNSRTPSTRGLTTAWPLLYPAPAPEQQRWLAGIDHLGRCEYGILFIPHCMYSNFKNRLWEWRKNQKLTKRWGYLPKSPNLRDIEAIQKFVLKEMAWWRVVSASGPWGAPPDQCSHCMWTVSAVASCVAADSPSTPVPDTSNQASNHQRAVSAQSLT